MTEASASTLTERGLVQQGYVGYSTDELAKLTWGLRFTPSVCMAAALVGLTTQTAWIHFVLAVHHSQQKSLKFSTLMQSQKRMISVCF